MNSEGALVMLLDAEREEIFILSAAYEDPAIEQRVKEIRFPQDMLVAGKVIQTGEPIIVNDPSETNERYRERDEKLGYRTRNLVLVPLRGRDRIIGVLGGVNKKSGTFGQNDTELLNTIGSTVALSIENARITDEVKQAYRTVKSLNRAKDKVIQHLSHELKTPVAVLSGSLSVLSKKLGSLPDATWQPTIGRARRNLDRIVAIQDEVSDIMEDRRFEVKDILSILLEECADELETLVVQEVGEGDLVQRIRQRIDDLFGPKTLVEAVIPLAGFVEERLKWLAGFFSHRKIHVDSDLEDTPPVIIPREVLEKVVDGLMRNAVENTPDGGAIDVMVHEKGRGAELVVRDHGVGIPEDARNRIFEGFFPTRDTMAYSSKRPYDFLAGGRGADLLRMKIFSERYGFDIQMTSSRCRHIPGESDICPGDVARCSRCTADQDCRNAGGTTFALYFPPKGHGA
jgi:signal transduction histidine kinase